MPFEQQLNSECRVIPTWEHGPTKCASYCNRFCVLFTIHSKVEFTKRINHLTTLWRCTTVIGRSMTSEVDPPITEVQRHKVGGAQFFSLSESDLSCAVLVRIYTTNTRSGNEKETDDNVHHTNTKRPPCTIKRIYIIIYNSQESSLTSIYQVNGINNNCLGACAKSGRSVVSTKICLLNDSLYLPFVCLSKRFCLLS